MRERLYYYSIAEASRDQRGNGKKGHHELETEQILVTALIGRPACPRACVPARVPASPLREVLYTIRFGVLFLFSFPTEPPERGGGDRSREKCDIMKQTNKQKDNAVNE